jgi:predicted  nucleic acid-binding Zn-ribbon protein
LIKRLEAQIDRLKSGMAEVQTLLEKKKKEIPKLQGDSARVGADLSAELSTCEKSIKDFEGEKKSFEQELSGKIGRK